MTKDRQARHCILVTKGNNFHVSCLLPVGQIPSKIDFYQSIFCPLIVNSFVKEDTSIIIVELLPLKVYPFTITPLHSERPKLHTVLAFLSVIGLDSGHGCFISSINIVNIYKFCKWNYMYSQTCSCGHLY